jgi:hypothetical protein
MPVIALTHENITEMRGILLEEGAKDEKWVLAADARIKTDGNALGVGPVAYKDRPSDDNGVYSATGTVKNALFLFFDDDGTATMSLTEDQEQADILLTVDDYLSSHGGDVTAMKALKPVVA